MKKQHTFEAPDLAILERAEKVSHMMRVLSHPQRLCMMCHLSTTPRTVTELGELCNLPQPQVSQFLARLKLEGFVEATRDGKNMIYNIADVRISAVIHALAENFGDV